MRLHRLLAGSALMGLVINREEMIKGDQTCSEWGQRRNIGPWERAGARDQEGFQNWAGQDWAQRLFLV